MMAMFDIVALSVIVICVLISMMRGVIAEVTSLLIWVVAFFMAKLFAAPFADFALTSVQPRAFAVVLGFILIFVAAWVVQHFLRSLLTAAVSAVGLGSVNRMLGGVFGAVKGILLVTLAVLVCAFTDLPKMPEWQQSYSAVYFEALAQLAVPYLPPFVGEQVQYPAL